jgi:arsenic resistance protein ArsH
MSRIQGFADPDRFPALDASSAISRPPAGLGDDQRAPRILLLYRSLRERSFSRFAAEEEARLLRFSGAEILISIRLTFRNRPGGRRRSSRLS